MPLIVGDAEGLQERGVLNDDRRPPLEDWLERKPGGWPRDPATVINHMNYARPALLAWSSAPNPYERSKR